MDEIVRIKDEIEDATNKIAEITRQKEAKAMEFKDIKSTIENLEGTRYRDFVKALVAVEYGIDDEAALDQVYEKYMWHDSISLIDEKFGDIIDELRDEGLIIDPEEKARETAKQVVPQTKYEEIVGNLGNDVEIKHIKPENAKEFDVANFSIYAKEEDGCTRYHSVSAYGKGIDFVKDYKKGDFVKVIGEEKITRGKDGKEYSNIRMQSTKMLKPKVKIQSQNKAMPKKRESIMAQIAHYKAKVEEDKKKPVERVESKDKNKELR